MGSLSLSPYYTPKPGCWRIFVTSNEAIHLCSKSAGTIMAKFGLSYQEFLMKMLQLTSSYLFILLLAGPQEFSSDSPYNVHKFF